MENKHGSGARAGSLEGKGFYIVLFLCAAVIGLSVWLMFTGAGTNVEDTAEAEENAVDVSGAFVTMLPANQSQQEQEDLVPAMSEDAEPVGPAETPETAAEPEQPGQETVLQQTDDEPADVQEQAPVQEVFSETVTSYIWPVQGDVSRDYAVETLAYDSTMGDWRTHDGVDVSCQQGVQVLAAAGGTVVDVSSSDLLGTTVEIDHANGVHSVYANLAEQPPVSVGQVVAMGDVIGSVGTSALGEVNQVSHLHFAMKKDGLTADPMLYLPGDALE